MLDIHSEIKVCKPGQLFSFQYRLSYMAIISISCLLKLSDVALLSVPAYWTTLGLWIDTEVHNYISTD